MNSREIIKICLQKMDFMLRCIRVSSFDDAAGRLPESVRYVAAGFADTTINRLQMKTRQ